MTKLNQQQVQNTLRAASLVSFIVISILLLLRVFHLDADFPNYSFWKSDEAKYSDEGWLANAGLNSVLLGKWYVPGDWTPAAVIPAWPALILGLFSVTGVSVHAVRAAEVVFSWAAFLLAWRLFRQHNSAWTSLAFALLAATSAITFVFSRIALVERPLEATALACVILAFNVSRGKWLPLAVLGALIALLILIKTSGAFLLPAILYPIWSRYRKDLSQTVLPLAIILGVAFALLSMEYLLFAKRYAIDAANFFAMNQPNLGWLVTPYETLHLLYRGTWIDPLLWPVSLLALLSSWWFRPLWRNPLWGVCSLWVLGYAAFIVYKGEVGVRYVSTLTFPVLMLVTMFMALLWRRVPRVAYAVIALSVVSVSWNLWQIQKFVRFPEYTMKNAAERILRTIDEHPESRRLIMGHGANQTSLFIGVPSIDDTEGAWSVAQRLAKYQPGWILMWNDEKLSELAAVTSKRNLKLLLNVPALDGKGRNHLTLFQIAALDSKF